MNKRCIYLRRMVPSRYDAKHYLVYLHEEVINDYVAPDEHGITPASSDSKPVTAYAYTGPEADGGTLIESGDGSRDTLINGVIRADYSQTVEDSLKTHMLMLQLNPDHERAAEWIAEWEAFCTARETAIALVDEWLANLQ